MKNCLFCLFFFSGQTSVRPVGQTLAAIAKDEIKWKKNKVLGET